MWAAAVMAPPGGWRRMAVGCDGGRAGAEVGGGAGEIE